MSKKGVTKTDFEALSVFRLAGGAHKRPEDGLCAMEAVAWLEGLAHTDHPVCTCDVIAAFVRGVNDGLDDASRQRLVAYLPRLVGTVSPEHRRERAEYLAWQAIRVFAPMALDAAGRKADAARLRDLPAGTSFYEAKKVAREVQKVAAAAYTTYAAAATAAAADAADAATTTTTIDAAAVGAAYATTTTIDAAFAAAAFAASEAAAAVFSALDGVLSIGPSGGFTDDVTPRVSAYRALVSA